MKKSICLSICLILSLTILSQTQHFYTSEKLSSNQISTICQDKVGYIWIGTEYGLNKYDSYRFTNYLHNDNDSNSISSNIVTFLFNDSKGNLWVGTQKGLEWYDHANDLFRHIKLNGAKDVPRVNYIIQEDENHLLVGTAGYGLYRLDIANQHTELV